MGVTSSETEFWAGWGDWKYEMATQDEARGICAIPRGDDERSDEDE